MNSNRQSHSPSKPRRLQISTGLPVFGFILYRIHRCFSGSSAKRLTPSAGARRLQPRDAHAPHEGVLLAHGVLSAARDQHRHARQQRARALQLDVPCFQIHSVPAMATDVPGVDRLRVLDAGGRARRAAQQQVAAHADDLGGQQEGEQDVAQEDCPASLSPACARASSRFSRGMSRFCAESALAKSVPPSLSSIWCAMHAAECGRRGRRARPASAWLGRDSACAASWSTLSVSSPDDTVSTRAHCHGSPRPPPRSARRLVLAARLALSSRGHVEHVGERRRRWPWTTSRALSTSSRARRASASIAASSTKMSTALRLMSALVSSVSSSSSSRRRACAAGRS